MDAECFVFIDETAATTAMTRLSGWSPRGERLVDAVPAGHWKTTTVVAGLRASGIIAPFVLDGPMVDSSGRRNTAYVSCSGELVQSLGRCSPAQGLSRPAVEGDRHGREVVDAVPAEVGALRKVLAQQPIGVLVRAALPRTVGIAEVDRHASLDPELGVLAHLCPLIPGQRSSQLFG